VNPLALVLTSKKIGAPGTQFSKGTFIRRGSVQSKGETS